MKVQKNHIYFCIFPQNQYSSQIISRKRLILQAQFLPLHEKKHLFPYRNDASPVRLLQGQGAYSQ